jgi:hypothetical protein
MRSRKLVVLSADRLDRAKILLNCFERAIVIGLVSMSIANSIHNSQDNNALKPRDRQQLSPQPIAETIDDRDRNYPSKRRALPLILPQISPFS